MLPGMLGPRLWTTIAALAFVGAGCGKSDGGKAPSGSAKGVEGAADAPRRGGHIVLPSNEPRDLNPALQTRFDRATPLIFEGLVGLDARMNVVPRLADSWELSDGGKTITFALRKGVTWHDGKPFTAADVAYTYEIIRKADRSTVWGAYLGGVQSVETPDDHTVVVRYAAPYGPALSTWSFGVIPKHLAGDDQPKGVGTGPYKFVRWEPGQRILLEAYDGYWGGRPNLDSIELALNVGAGEQLDLLRQGKLDFVEISDVTQWSHEAQTPDFRDTYEVATEVESRFRMIAWNEQRDLFEDKRVRRAMTLAMDRNRAVEEVLLGEARPLSGPFFPTMYGADPSIAPLPFDLDRAAALLDEAGHPVKGDKRFTVELLARKEQRDPAMEQMLGIFRRDLETIGVELKVEYLDTREFFDRIVLREFDAALLGWLPDIPDPDPYALLHSSQINAGPNFAGYVNSDVDRLLDEARAEPDRTARKDRYHQIHRIVHEDQPYTMLYAPYGHYAWSRRLRGVNPRDIGTQPRFPGVANWWLAPKGS